MDCLAEPERDAACVRRVVSGERNAFNELVARYESRVFSLLLMMMRDRPAAQEVSQEAFLRAYSNLARYDQSRPFYPWLATIAARLGLNWINRTAASRNRTGPDLDIAEAEAQTPGPADDLERRQVSQTLWELVADLPQGERTAVLMFYQQELKVSEIATILGVTEGTIKTLLHRGRKHLKAHLESTGDET